jgi:large subunit ribosomal protein L5
MDRFNKHFEEIVEYDILYKDRSTNVTQVPKINSIAINTGIGKKAVIDNKHISTALSAIEPIAGQKPVITRAKKWVDKFQLKKNMPIGCKATLRHNNMHHYLDRLINRVIPRIEDFRGSLRNQSPSKNTFASSLSGLHDSSYPLSFR